MCDKLEARMADPFLEMMSVRKPTKIHQLVRGVARPPGAVSLRPGFPQWDEAPLYLNLSLPTGMPKEVTMYHREKLGEKLWKGYGKALSEYFLKDPNAYELSFPYEARHDPNLQLYYRRKPNREHMERNGFITKGGQVLCTLAEYNVFRRYLYRTQQFHLHNAIWWNDVMERERFELRKFREFLQRDIERSDRDEYFREASAKLRDERLAAELKESTRLETQRQAKMKRTQTALVRHLKRRLVQKERQVQAGRRVYQQLQLTCSNKRGLGLRTMRRMHDHHVEERRRDYLRSVARWESRNQKAWARYKCKVQSQLQRYQREEELLDWDSDLREQALVERSRLLDVEKHRMMDLLETIQTRHVRELAVKRAQKKKEKFVQAIKKAWGIPEGHSPWLVEQAVLAALARNKAPEGGHEVLATLQDIKDKLQVSAQQPEEVTYALDILLDNVIKEFIRRNMIRVLQETQTKITDKVNATVAALRGRRRSSQLDGLRRRSSLTAGGRRRSSLMVEQMLAAFQNLQAESPPESPPESSPRRRSSLKAEGADRERSTSLTGFARPTRSISFGAVATIGKFIPIKEMLPTKDRPPTPVPSLENLAVLVLEEPVEIKPKIEDSNEEQQKLISLFKSLQEILYSNVLKYFETRSPVYKIMFTPGLSGTHLRINDVVRRLTEKIAESDDEVLHDSDELHLAEEYLIQELQNKLPILREISKENTQGIRRPSI